MTSDDTKALENKFTELHDQFTQQLPQRLDALRAQLKALAASPDSTRLLDQLSRTAHSLAGAAGTFGMRALSDAARSLEGASRRVDSAGNRAVDPGELATLLSAVEANAASTDHPAHPGPALARRVNTSNPMIYIADDDPLQASALATGLEAAGFQVRSFETLDEFHAACNDPALEKPAAILMDMSFPEGPTAGAATIAELRAGGFGEVPVVFVAACGRMASRLAALRAGAVRYLVKPVAHERLVALLDAVTQRRPRDPYHVLLVDDDNLSLELHASMLRSFGIEVTTLADPLKVFATLDCCKPDVLALDVYMESATGPEIAAILRDRDDHLELPILFLSWESEVRPKLDALGLGGDAFLEKPVQAQYLADAVIALARRARQAGAIRKRLETTLYEQRRQQTAIDEHALVSIADGRGNIVYVNQRFCQVSGFSREELLGQNHRIIKSGRHPHEFYREMWRAISRGEIWQGEICNRRKDGTLYWVASTIVPFVDESGRPYQYVSIRTDITHLLQVQDALARRGKLQKLIARIAARFLAARVEEVDAVVQQALAESGAITGADRAYVFLFTDDEKFMSNTHEWCAAGIRPQKDELQDLPVEISPWWWEQADKYGYVNIEDVARLPPEEGDLRELLEIQNIRSLVAVPLQNEGRHFGFLGYDSVGAHRCWTDDELELLKLIADVICGGLVRHQTTLALRKLQQDLVGTLESTQDGILAIDGNRKVIFANRQFIDTWNLPPEIVFAGQEDSVLLDHARLQAKEPEAFHDGCESIYLASGDSSSDLLELADGRIIHRLSRPRTRDGVPDGRVWSFRDITARKRAEDAAEYHKERLRRGQIYANIGTWEWNIRSGELFWTERIAPLFGYPEGNLETSYENFLAAVHPEDRPQVVAAVEACIQRDGPYQIEHRVVWPDGTERWLLERGAVVRDEHGTPLQMIGVVQDIDDRKRAELAVQERERLLREAQSLAKLGNWHANLATGEVSWSDEIYRIFGRDRGTFEPSVANFIDAVHPDDLPAVQAARDRALQSGHMEVVHRILRPDGTLRHVQEIASLHADEEGRHMLLVGTVQDVTERVETERALIAAREESERANHAKSEFLSSMSHELRTPMNAILGFGQLLELDGALSPEAQDNVREILRASNHLLELINEILDLAKIESGHLKLQSELVDVCIIVRECMALVTGLAQRRNIALEHSCPEGSFVRTDRTRLKQALLNLMSNAVKYNRDGGEVHIDAAKLDGFWMRINVRDTGSGIPEEQLEEVFQPFHRLSINSSGTEGTGIGLAITRRIVEMMGGSLAVDSEVGVGSVFSVDLPLAIDGASSESELPIDATIAQEKSGSRNQAPGRRVLCIEDNAANTRLVRQILKRRPAIELRSAEAPEEGLELAAGWLPELILLDINMPNMSGYEVLAELKRDARLAPVPIVAITANAMPRDIERGLRAGFSAYLTKPLNVDEFLETVDHYLQRPPAARGKGLD